MFDWITGFVESAGYAGIVLLMFAENVFPPIPSEVIMPLAGFTAAQGDLNVIGVVAAGTFGTLAGALVWYYIGLRMGLDWIKRIARRHGRWLTLDEHEIDNASRWFQRHGKMALVVGHLVPAVRTLISLPAGVSRMPMLPFLAASALGTVAWTAVLTAAGYLLQSQYERVEGYANIATNIVLGLMLAWYVYRVVTWPGTRGESRRESRKDSGEPSRPAGKASREAITRPPLSRGSAGSGSPPAPRTTR